MKIAVSVPEAAEIIDVGRSTIYELIRKGELTPRKCGKRTLLLVEDLKRYVESLPAA